MDIRSNQPGLAKVMRSAKPMISAVTLGIFILLAVLATYPTALRLSDFTVFATDSLLESWTLKWDVHALLAGPAGIRHIWDANIFYPYPATLAFSEHLLPTALLLMPFTLLGRTPLVATNLGVLLSTALSGWGVYLLVTWLTGNRWAGLIAGLFFAISPFRMGHLIQLHLLSTHWLPFAFLALARLIKLNRPVDLILLLIFTNLQFFSVINYAPLVAATLAVWAIFYLLAYRSRLSPSLFMRLFIFGLVTLALNWPVLRLYQQVSDQMGVARTLGDARIYGASLLHYVLPMANSLLYTRWLHGPALIDSAFPGLVVFGLATIGVISAFRPRSNGRLTMSALALLVITITGFTLSFGANETAFGADWAPVVAPLLPYPYLYELLPLLEGLRVPLRFALLPTFGLAILAGLGFAALGRRWGSSGRRSAVVAGLVGALILVEHLPAPLPGESVPYGGQLYSWLAGLPQEAVVLELPYYLHTEQSFKELTRVYQSTRHWRRLVNGASGFKPAWLVKLGPVLDGFPDWRSFDAIRQLGVDYVLLHRDQYDATAWDNLVALLPGYLPAIEAVYTVGDDLVLQLSPPQCQVDADRVQLDANAFPMLSISNNNPTTFFANPQRGSWIATRQQRRQFLEPLFILPGQSITLTLPVAGPANSADWQVELGNLGQNLSPDELPAASPVADSLPAERWQPVQIPFTNGAILQAVAIGDGQAVETCSQLSLNLQWTFPADAGEIIRVELIDRFNRLVISSQAQPVVESESLRSSHSLPLAETVPPGRYQLRVRLLNADGADIAPVGPDGAAIAEGLTLPLVIRPRLAEELAVTQPAISYLANEVLLLGAKVRRHTIQPGEWVRFTLQWQSQGTLTGDYTIFTQFLGPDGQVWGQQDNPPKGGWYPTSLWTPGEIIIDDYAVRIDPAAPAGEYRLIVGMYDPATGERVLVTKGSGQDNNFVDVATIIVANPY